MSYPGYPSRDPDDQRPVAPFPRAAEGYPRYGPAANPSHGAPPGYYYPPPPKPLHGLGRAATWLAAAVSLVGLIQAALAWPAHSRFTEAVDRGETFFDVWTSYDTVGLILFAVMIAAYVVTCLWLYRARTNSTTMQPHLHHARSPGWAWGGWICPVVNFWFPFQVVRDVGRDQSGLSALSGLGAWWTFWLLSSITTAVGGQLAGVDTTPSVFALFVTVGAVLNVVALTFWVRIVRDVTQLQDTLMGSAAASPGA